MAFIEAAQQGEHGTVYPFVSDNPDGPELGQPGATPSRRILLVEDERPFRELLQAFLETQGYEVHAVPDGRCGAQWLETNVADAVVTDLCMPEVDGMELLMKIRKLHRSTPVVVMSGGVSGNMVGMLRAAELLGARRTLEKPFSLQQLATALREVVEHRT